MINQVLKKINFKKNVKPSTVCLRVLLIFINIRDATPELNSTDMTLTQHTFDLLHCVSSFKQDLLYRFFKVKCFDQKSFQHKLLIEKLVQFTNHV